MIDPLAGSAWSEPGTVSGFERSAPNQVLLEFARAELASRGRGRLLDIGCGAARNAQPLAEIGWDVVGIDLSAPMLRAAVARAGAGSRAGRQLFALAPMDWLPIADLSADCIVAHGIWNLASSGAMFRRAVAEAARVAASGAALFVFTFSRHTLPPDTQPLAGERFVFTQFSGRPQVFLTEGELVAELDGAGFTLERDRPIREYNRPTGKTLSTGSVPVIYEGIFRNRR
ncbi:MAG: methyltransferase domain-containing protein [Vicinamibacterales bacterium]